jgi:hypothetical protein
MSIVFWLFDRAHEMKITNARGARQSQPALIEKEPEKLQSL